jgi:hypothetical protein
VVVGEFKSGVGDEYELESCETKQRIRIYQAHTYQDVNQRLADFRQNRDSRQTLIKTILANADKRSKKGK